MATSTKTNHKTIELLYRHNALLRNFIQTRVANDEDAADLVQEVMVRLLEYKEEIVPETAKALAYAIASNAVNDYLRRKYLRQASEEDIAALSTGECNVTEEDIISRDLKRLERRRLAAMPPQRRMVYMMRLHEEKTTKEVADFMNLSTRTVENHFYIGIRQMRACFAAAI